MAAQIALTILLITSIPLLAAQVYLRADGLSSEAYGLINSVLGPGASSQVPDCHHNVTHIWQDYDPEVNHSVFHFSAHVAYDNDRCVVFDRQRTEIGPDEGDLTGLYGDWMTHTWDFRLDENFQVSYMFTHVSQIKAKGGKDSMPMVTTQLIKTEDDQDFLQVIHMNGLALNSTTNATILAQVDLNEFRGQWIHVEQKILFGWDGAYFIRMTRMRDDKILVRVEDPNIEMWRYDNGDNKVKFTFPKWGLYRSLNYNYHLRDEIVKFDNFCLAKNNQTCF